MNLKKTDFQQFIEFGNIFDRPTREYLVQYLLQKVQTKTEHDTISDLSDNKLEYLKESLDKIFTNQNTQKVTQENPHLAQQIIEDTLKWLRDTVKKGEAENPYEEEKKELDRWHGKPAFLWVQSWYHLTNYLRDLYSKEDLNSEFYAEKFEEITRPINIDWLLKKKKNYDEPLKQMEVVMEDLLDKWESLLTAKSLQYELEHIDEQREQFCALLYAKIDEFVKLLNVITPFAYQVGNFWDMSRGLWQSSNFDILEKYSQILEKEDSIRALADMLGKLREAEIEMEEEFYEEVISKKTWMQDFEKKDEIGGVYESKELAQTLPSELGYLGYPETESIFLKRYADASLLSYQFQGRTLVNSDEINHLSQQKQKQKERGPFIICVDTSGSMEGLPEQIAKTLCFAILKMAAREQRKCYLISFSIGIQTINLLDLANSLDEVVKFLTMSFHGGTDVTPALAAAMRMLSNHDYKEADILMVSDFVMFEIREEIVKRIKQEQKKGTMFHSLTISTQSNPEVIEVFDNQWMYHPEDRKVIKHLVKDLRHWQQDNPF